MILFRFHFNEVITVNFLFFFCLRESLKYLFNLEISPMQSQIPLEINV